MPRVSDVIHAQVLAKLQEFDLWMCTELRHAKDLSDAFGDARKFRLFFFDGLRENFSVDTFNNSVGTVPVRTFVHLHCTHARMRVRL